jgi:hypothetical protein
MRKMIQAEIVKQLSPNYAWDLRQVAQRRRADTCASRYPNNDPEVRSRGFKLRKECVFLMARYSLLNTWVLLVEILG